jgi:hypothetical protein
MCVSSHISEKLAAFVGEAGPDIAAGEHPSARGRVLAAWEGCEFRSSLELALTDGRLASAIASRHRRWHCCRPGISLLVVTMIATEIVRRKKTTKSAIGRAVWPLPRLSGCRIDGGLLCATTAARET